MAWSLILILVGVALLLPTAYAGLIGAPYAPTRRLVVKKAFDELGIGSDDVLVDLGAGDGKIVFESSNRGARSYGYELSPIMWGIAWVRSLFHKDASIVFGNFYNRKIEDATIVFAFLMPDNMPRVKKWLARQSVPRGRYLLAYMFPFQDEPPLRIVRAKDCGPIYIYDLREMTKSGKG